MEKKLYRNLNNKFLAGVCSGLADYLGIDATVVRLLVALFSLLSFGWGVLIYIMAAIIIPQSPEAQQNAAPPEYQPPTYQQPFYPQQPTQSPPQQSYAPYTPPSVSSTETTASTEATAPIIPPIPYQQNPTDMGGA